MQSVTLTLSAAILWGTFQQPGIAGWQSVWVSKNICTLQHARPRTDLFICVCRLMEATHQALPQPVRVLNSHTTSFDGKDCNLTVLECGPSSSSARYLLLKEVSQLFLNNQMKPKPLQYWLQKKALITDRPQTLRQLDPETKRVLVASGKCDARGSPPICATISSFTKALQGRFPADALKGLQIQAASPQPQPVSHASPTPHPPPACPVTPLVFASSCPQSLPKLDASQQIDRAPWLTLSRSSPELLEDGVLKAHLLAFASYCSDPIFVGRGTTPLSEESITSVQTKLMQFLGYIHTYMGVSHPNLSHVLHADLLAHYFAARVQCSIRGSTLGQDVSCLKKVVTWWSTQGQARSHMLEISQVLTWLGNLRSQLMACNAAPAPDPVVELKGQQDLGVSADLVQVLQGKLESVEAICASILSNALALEDARLMHDVLMAIMMFGWVGCIRAKPLRTLICPGQNVACPFSTCTSSGCKGNRMHEIAAEAYMVVLPHHKTSKSRGTISAVLPQDVNPIVSMYMSKAYPVLKANAHAKTVSHPYMFMNTKGGEFSESALYNYWKRLMDKWGGPVRGPHFMRHLFVEERLSESRVEGPSDHDAAMLMGNSTRTWGSYYHKRLADVYAQKAVDKMAAWRQNVIAAAKKQKTSHATIDHTNT